MTFPCKQFPVQLFCNGYCIRVVSNKGIKFRPFFIQRFYPVKIGPDQLFDGIFSIFISLLNLQNPQFLKLDLPGGCNVYFYRLLLTRIIQEK